MPNELPIPNVALTSHNAIELLRVWAASGAQHVSIATEIWEDPGNWGIVLVDLAKHIANAYEKSNKLNKENTLERIKEIFEAEWSNPTSEPSGDLL